MSNYRKFGRMILCSLITTAVVTIASSAYAETISRNCPFSCRTLGRSNDPSCHDFRVGNKCTVTINGGVGTNSNNSSSGLKICKRGNSAFTVRGQCKSNETVVTPGSLSKISDISLVGVPAGSTIMGVVGATGQASTTSTSFASAASTDALILPLLGSESIIVASSTALTTGCSGSPTNCLADDENSTNTVCTGTAAAPSAPSGKLCIYPTAVTNSSAISASAIPDTGTSSGFNVSWTAPLAGTTTFQGVWAYTAP